MKREARYGNDQQPPPSVIECHAGPSHACNALCQHPRHTTIEYASAVPDPSTVLAHFAGLGFELPGIGLVRLVTARVAPDARSIAEDYAALGEVMPAKAARFTCALLMTWELIEGFAP